MAAAAAAACRRGMLLHHHEYSHQWPARRWAAGPARSIAQLVKTNGHRAFLVDTLAMVVPTKHAEAITSAITEVLNDSLESISESFVTNAEMQKSEMLQEANISKFKSQVQSSQENHFSLLQRETEKLRGDIDKMRSELKLVLPSPGNRSAKRYGDRFIPYRGSATDREDEKENAAAAVPRSPSSQLYRRLLAEKLLNNRTRILAFRNTPPEPFDSIFTESSVQARPKRRRIPQTPDRMLDASTCWTGEAATSSNVLSIALGNSMCRDVHVHVHVHASVMPMPMCVAMHPFFFVFHRQ